MMRASILALALVCTGTAVVVGATKPAAVVVNQTAINDPGMPGRLAEFGFFTDAAAQIPAAGVTPYRLNTPLYSDGADKLRFVHVPHGTKAIAQDDGLLDLPVGSALIKTFSFTENGRRRLIETRVLLHRASGWEALPYLWNAEQTEARLAIVGAWVDAVTPAGEAIRYRVPNKNQCKECHGVDGKVVPIGPKARNLSHDWLAAMVAAGHLDAVPKGADAMPLWETRGDAPLDKAARAYLDVNCAHCHRPGATASNSGLDLRWEQADPAALGVGKRPVAAGRGAGGHLFDIVPGKPGESILHYRMNSSETGVAMPELGKATVDRDGVALIERWIAAMKP